MAMYSISAEEDVARLVESIRAAAERQGVTQLALSAKTGIAQPKISRYFLGKTTPSLTSAARLAEAVGLRLVLAAK